MLLHSKQLRNKAHRKMGFFLLPQAEAMGFYLLRLDEALRLYGITKNPEAAAPGLSAVRTGLEPATPCVTGMYSNQLNYRTSDSCFLLAIAKVRTFVDFANFSAVFFKNLIEIVEFFFFVEVGGFASVFWITLFEEGIDAFFVVWTLVNSLTIGVYALKTLGVD